MEIKIIQIGNSKGIRLPKSVLDQVGLGARADLVVEAGKIIISPKRVREGWAEAFEAGGADSAEDQEWIAAELDDDADWEW